MDRRLVDDFRAVVGKHGLVCSPEDLHTYECDGLTNFRVMPQAVLLPANAEVLPAAGGHIIDEGYLAGNWFSGC